MSSKNIFSWILVKKKPQLAEARQLRISGGNRTPWEIMWCWNYFFVWI